LITRKNDHHWSKYWFQNQIAIIYAGEILEKEMSTL
jgi:hypothetical protein